MRRRTSSGRSMLFGPRHARRQLRPPCNVNLRLARPCVLSQLPYHILKRMLLGEDWGLR
jgi:hypothetical protein